MVDSPYFTSKEKEKILLWCDRHCCLCGKPSGLDIEIAHIIAKSKKKVENETKGDIDNAIPLCFSCHAAIGRYRADHPKGTRYRESELKTRRNQIYEKFTRQLVPPIKYRIYQDFGTRYPNVRFFLQHGGNEYPVKILSKFEIFFGEKSQGFPDTPNGLYNGSTWWNMNPQGEFNGWFPLPKSAVTNHETVEVRVNIKIMDIYERVHDLLPVGWVYMGDERWFFEPGESLHISKTPYQLDGWGTFGMI